ncbi:hypothetical protein HEP86_30015 [Streptomyces sp. RPA4-5]|uniref:hypothetical protein n=1 Tax=Streptomyces sp. RPA4-5 TaxID=2721245 RepID=UPI00143EC3C7|nr:hypothetical protein [Streptomyces sp. RPA4-5]QIY53179.1 hypothetical protein HEP86_30015 [Streptomyces sp. RPA4-5]
MLGRQSLKIFKFCLLDLGEEVIARSAGPVQIGFGALYALQNACGESVHVRPLVVGRWARGVPTGGSITA